LELADEAASVGLFVSAEVVVGAGVVVGLMAGEHVVGDDEDGVADGDDGSLVAASSFESGVVGGEVGVLGAGGGLGRLDGRVA
jgi:hypothetical protein